MEQPWLIQRCKLGNRKLRYEYMGSTEFELGSQAKALKRIFATGVAVGSANISVGGKKITVYMVAFKGFPFADYQPYLQQLAEHKLRLKEPDLFNVAVKAKDGILTDRHSPPRTNAWFDFQNDVLWTLTENDQEAIVAVLEDIRKKWAEEV